MKQQVFHDKPPILCNLPRKVTLFFTLKDRGLPMNYTDMLSVDFKNRKSE